MDLDDFISGCCLTAVLISLLLGSQYGLHFNYLSAEGIPVLLSFGEALNWRTLIIVTVLFWILFRNIKGPWFYRLIAAFGLVWFMWAVNDFLWMLKWDHYGQFLFGSAVRSFPSSRDLWIGSVRNVLIMVVTFPLSVHFRLSKEAGITFILWGLYWILILLPWRFSGRLFGPFTYAFFAYLPYITLVKSWSRNSWIKFLFC